MMMFLLDYLNHLDDTIGQDDSDGYLALKKVRGTTRFFLRKDGSCTYLKREEVSRLAQKSYLRELKKAANKEIKQLNTCLSILNSEKDGISDINEVYASLPDPLKPFVKPLSLSDDDYAARWQEGNLVVKRKRIHAEDDYHKFKTMRGETSTADFRCSCTSRTAPSILPIS